MIFKLFDKNFISSHSPIPLGQLNPNDIVARLQRSSGRVELIMAQMRADRQERVQSRQIREQQDEAYLASLRADQEKVRVFSFTGCSYSCA